MIPCLSLGIRAAELQASDGAAVDVFGWSVSQSGGWGLVGAAYDRVGSNPSQGSAYLFRDLENARGTLTQSAKLVASDGASNDGFGYSVIQAGASGLIGAVFEGGRGSAYLFRDLDVATGTVTENLKLTASDGIARDAFGRSVGLQGSLGLIGAPGDVVRTDLIPGAAYVFRNLDTASGTVTEDAKLVASDGENGDGFGTTVSLSGTTGLVAARADDFDSRTLQGSAYLFRNLDTASGTVTEDAKLVASDGQAGDRLGVAASLSGNVALLGATGDSHGSGNMRGSVYLYRDLDTGVGTLAEQAKLSAFDLSAKVAFGETVSLSGDVGLVGASPTDSTSQAHAYLFLGLGAAVGSVNESVRLNSSAGREIDGGISALSLDGDQFVIGMIAGDGAVVDSGKAYTGSVASLTTLDAGNTRRDIDGISFESRMDWVIGRTTDSNQVTLGEGDTASVEQAGTAVFIGQGHGADDNLLVIEGSLFASAVHVGSLSGNMGNTLRLENVATFEALAVRLAPANFFEIAGDQTSIEVLLGYLGATDLQVWDGLEWTTVDAANHEDWITSSYASETGFTRIAAVPEPGVLMLAGLGFGFSLTRRRPSPAPSTAGVFRG